MEVRIISNGRYRETYTQISQIKELIYAELKHMFPTQPLKVLNRRVLDAVSAIQLTQTDRNVHPLLRYLNDLNGVWDLDHKKLIAHDPTG